MTLRDADVKVLLSLMANCRKSDREVSKEVGLSQPTITRRRGLLENNGVIQRYIAVPDFAKLGFRIIAVNFGSWDQNVMLDKESMAKLHKNVLFMATGQGGNADLLCISVHHDYSSVVNFRRVLASIGINSQTFLIDTKTEIIKPFNMDLSANDLKISK